MRGKSGPESEILVFIRSRLTSPDLAGFMVRAVVLLFVASFQPAQAQTAVAPLPPDHHDVYYSFFQDESAWQQAVTALTPSNPAQATQLTNAAASQMHIDSHEAAIVSTIASSTVTAVKTLLSQRDAYLKANPQASATATNQYELQRQQMIMAGVTSLMKQLTRRSWMGLHTYINWDQRVNASTLIPGGK